MDRFLPAINRTHVNNEVHMVISNKFLKGLLLYNVLLYTMFLSIYLVIDFKKHFHLPEHTEDITSTIAYYTLLSQTQVMAGEIVPKTRLGRYLLMTHVFLSWFMIALVMVPWAST